MTTLAQGELPGRAGAGARWLVSDVELAGSASSRAPALTPRGVIPRVPIGANRSHGNGFTPGRGCAHGGDRRLAAGLAAVLAMYLVTGAGGGIGSVSRQVVELLLEDGQPCARWCVATTTGQRHFASWVPRWSSVI